MAETPLQSIQGFQTLVAFLKAIIWGDAATDIDLGGAPPTVASPGGGSLVPSIRKIIANLPAAILTEYLSLTRYAATGDGATDDTAAWNSFMGAAALGPRLVSAARYLVSGGLIRFDKPTIINTSLKELNNGQFRDSLGVIKRVPIRRGANVHLFADSMGVGYGLGSPTVFGYAYRFAADTGTTLLNHAVSGRGTFEMTKQVFINLPAFGRTSADVPILIATHNDDYRGGDAANTREKIKGELRSALVSAFAKTCIAANNGAITEAGTWNNMDASLLDKATLALGANGRFSAVQNSTQTYTFTGQRFSLGCYASDGVHERVGEFTIQIDGATIYGPYQFDGTVDGISDGAYDNALCHQEVPLDDLGTGAHTAIVKVTSNTGRPVYLTTYTTLQSPSEAAPVIIGQTVRPNATAFATIGAWTEAAMLHTDQAIADVVAEFADYPISVAPLNDYFDVRNVQVDNEHPTVAGHAQLNRGLKCAVLPRAPAPTPLVTIVALTANQSIPNVTQTGIAFNLERRDDDGLHDTAANQTRLVPARATTVELSGYVGFAASAAGNRIVSLYKNGSSVRDIGSVTNCGGTQYVIVPFYASIVVAPTDYLEIRAQQDSGGALNVLAANTECTMRVAL